MHATTRTALLTLALALTPSTVLATKEEPAAPLGDADFADPFVLREGSTYYAFATGTGARNLQVARSTDLVEWSLLAHDPLPVLPAWAARESGLTWAPSVLRRARGWVLYYTTADVRSGYQCISRAFAKRPEGPYVDDSEGPLVCQTEGDAALCGSIDPSPFVDAGGRAWLLWKSDENAPACKTAPRIWSQPLAADGLSLVGKPVSLLARDRAWEGPIVEGPSMIRDGEGTILFYSANWYEGSDYAVGWARCAGPAGPCTKMTTDAPLLASAGAALGPGGQEPFVDAHGRAFVAYHAWTAPVTSYAGGGARSLRVAPLAIADGLPSIGAALHPVAAERTDP